MKTYSSTADANQTEIILVELYFWNLKQRSRKCFALTARSRTAELKRLLCVIRWRTFRHGARRPSHLHPRPPRLPRRRHLHRQIFTTPKHKRILIVNDITTSDICSRASSKVIYTHINSNSKRRNHRRSSSKPWTTITTSPTMDSRTMISKVKKSEITSPNLSTVCRPKMLSINFHFLLRPRGEIPYSWCFFPMPAFIVHVLCAFLSLETIVNVLCIA